MSRVRRRDCLDGACLNGIASFPQELKELLHLRALG